MKPTEEINFLKNIVKAQNKMIQNYRAGKTSLPEWVFIILDKAHKQYGNNLTKII